MTLSQTVKSDAKSLQNALNTPVFRAGRLPMFTSRLWDIFWQGDLRS